MLGTLVALAVARMVNLETFVWDMPTGVLRDVWLALSSLQNHAPSQDCRLERVWVRWHDNSDSSSVPPPPAQNSASNGNSQPLAGSTIMTSVGWTLPANMATPQVTMPLTYAQSRVEYPTLSVLPPLKSLSVLDIDELDYLDEMSVLIAKSQDRLRELRVGISSRAVTRDFALSWDGPGLQQVDHKAQWPGASTIGDRRLGGVLGVLLGRVYDIRRKPKAKVEKRELSAAISASVPAPSTAQEAQITNASPSNHDSDALLSHVPELVEGSWEEDSSGKENDLLSEAVSLFPAVSFNLDDNPQAITNGLEPHPQNIPASTPDEADIQSLTALVSVHQIDGSVLNSSTQSEIPIEPPLRRSQSQSHRYSHFSETASSERTSLEGKLRLQTLELERVALSVVVLQKAFDWSVLTNLTILDCAQHDRLWVMLRKSFAPTTLGPIHGSSRHHGAGVSVQYHLNLKKIHTDAASPALISFLKETLAPNTLETLFLQDRKRTNTTSVTIVGFQGPESPIQSIC